jgi:hypothetical protein
MVVASSSTAASVIVTPNSIVRMIVSATTGDGQAVAFDRVTSVAWRASVGACIVTHRGPASPKRHEPAHRDVANLRCTLDYEEPDNLAEALAKSTRPTVRTSLIKVGSELGIAQAARKRAAAP